jgi:hypothetical protein
MGVWADILAGAGGAAGSTASTPDVRHQPEVDVQSYTGIYHMIHALNISAGGVAVRVALLCAWDPWLESRHYAYFCKMFYTRIYAYILTCTQIHSVYTSIYGLVSVFMWSCISVQIYRVILGCMLMYSVYTSIYSFVLSTAVAFVR